MATRHRKLREVGSLLIRFPDRAILHLDPLKILLHRHGLQLTARTDAAAPHMSVLATLKRLEEI
jgi:hypothetical protein